MSANLDRAADRARIVARKPLLFRNGVLRRNSGGLRLSAGRVMIRSLAAPMSPVSIWIAKRSLSRARYIALGAVDRLEPGACMLERDARQRTADSITSRTTSRTGASWSRTTERRS